MYKHTNNYLELPLDASKYSLVAIKPFDQYPNQTMKCQAFQKSPPRGFDKNKQTIYPDFESVETEDACLSPVVYSAIAEHTIVRFKTIEGDISQGSIVDATIFFDLHKKIVSTFYQIKTPFATHNVHEGRIL